MTQKSWPWSTVAALGDGAVTLSEANSREFLALWFGVQDPTEEGVSKGVGGELAVTGTASPLAVASGSAICYGLYINDTPVNTAAIATPAIGPTGGRVVLQTNWAGTGGAGLEARTRVAVKMSADGNGAIPALTQTPNVTWEISLATFVITTGGVITVTDDRTFRRVTGVVTAAEIIDLSIATADLPDNGVTNAKLRDSVGVSVIGRAANSTGDPADIAAGADDRVLARTGGVLAFVQATLAMIPDSLITLAKLANLAGTSLLGRSANSTGVMAAITAAANDTLLRRTGDALNFGALTIGMVADGLLTFAKLASLAGVSVLGRSANSSGVMAAITAAANDRLLARVGDALSFVQLTAGMVPASLIDDTKVGNRVLQFYRYQAGAADWLTPGTSAQTPGEVRSQGGIARWTGAAATSGSVTITLPVAFSAFFLAFATHQSSIAREISVVTFVSSASQFTIRWQAPITYTQLDFHWFVIGPE